MKGINGGTVTTTAAHTLSGWAGSQLTSIPSVDLAPGGYASAGIEWRNGTDDGSKCALVADFAVVPPAGGTPTQFAAGTPSLTDGPACASFQVHPVVAGVDPAYGYTP